jgi:mono/diheme cytochrome c family protein
VRANPSRRQAPARSRTGLFVVVGLTLASAAAVSLWMLARSAEERRTTEALAPWVGAPLPARGDTIDPALAALGATVFERHCAACHAVRGEPKIGPNLAGVTQRRDAAWIRAMVLRPDSMTRDDPVAAALKESYGVQMMVVGEVGEVHARAVIEFLLRVDGQRTGG